MTTDKTQRKDMPMARGLLDYFPDALAYVAHVSKVGNDQHNPGEEMHWAKDKSTDHADCIIRHMAERGSMDDDGLRHSGKVAWRALAMLQLELEAAAKQGKSIEEMLLEGEPTERSDESAMRAYLEKLTEIEQRAVGGYAIAGINMKEGDYFLVQNGTAYICDEAHAEGRVNEPIGKGQPLMSCELVFIEATEIGNVDWHGKVPNNDGGK